MIIKSFACSKTQSLYETGETRYFSGIKSIAERKLAMIESASHINDLRIPPANRLEKLSGDRDGQYSIRINDQYRICFVLEDDGVSDVEIVDYH